ncbi:uncharacterized protein LOC127241494 [Andrographis paniculata]|uniref:uncharacterized protein LOC127241494 n=1 Tax=Andrographis paniculata TaxID=175694 RepID=UPI0021E9A02A|nr:uncharacterized protein LOC127241494 [Andrographis paniculata]
MALIPSTFETLVPSRYIAFTIPGHPHRIAVLDSPAAASEDAAASTAAMRVPLGRESDWIFSTFSGHLQLLLSSPTSQPLSRLILIGNPQASPHPISYDYSTVIPNSAAPPRNLAPLLLALTPKSATGEIPEPAVFLDYEDEVIRSSILEICEGPRVGEMLIENVELEIDGGKEFRRRLRFKRMPNFIQTQISIHPKEESKLESLDSMEFDLDSNELVQPYLIPMVAGISVLCNFLEDRIVPRALCLGVGGGALLMFLHTKLSFEVVGVEADAAVIQVAKRYFGLECNDTIDLIVEDAIKYVNDLSIDVAEGNKFDVVMVDLDSDDAEFGVCAPPRQFVSESVFRAINGILCDKGALIINVIPLSKLSYQGLISEVGKVFEELYEIDVGNGENFVLVATKLRIESAFDADECGFLRKLRLVVPGSYLDSIRKIPKTN